MENSAADTMDGMYATVRCRISVVSSINLLTSIRFSKFLLSLSSRELTSMSVVRTIACIGTGASMFGINVSHTLLRFDETLRERRSRSY